MNICVRNIRGTYKMAKLIVKFHWIFEGCIHSISISKCRLDVPLFVKLGLQ